MLQLDITVYMICFCLTLAMKLVTSRNVTVGLFLVTYIISS